jgi:hypothetical protein
VKICCVTFGGRGIGGGGGVRYCAFSETRHSGADISVAGEVVLLYGSCIQPYVADVPLLLL